MKISSRFLLRASALTLFYIAGSSEVSATLITRQMTFEEVTTQAKVIVLGRVSKIPELAVYDRATKHVYRRNSVHVEEYLKGTGPMPEIEVVTLGGQFVTDGLGLKGPRIQDVEYGLEPQLPPVGSEVLLFLNPFSGGEAFIIYSVTHGVIRVQEGEKGQERFVSLLFGNPDLVSPDAAARSQAMNHEVPDGSGTIVILDRVPVSALKATVDKALNLKRKPAAAPKAPWSENAGRAKDDPAPYWRMLS